MATSNPPGLGQGQMNPTSLGVEEMAKLLSAAGQKRITTEQVQADIDAGAPVTRLCLPCDVNVFSGVSPNSTKTRSYPLKALTARYPRPSGFRPRTTCCA